MSAETLVNSLDFVRQSGPNKWIARCPAHDDSSPSLSIKALPDGRTLIHCHAGCPTESVVSAVGLSLSDLFPENDNYASPIQQKYQLQISEDVLVVAIWDADRAKNIPVKKADIERYKLALLRLKGVAA